MCITLLHLRRIKHSNAQLSNALITKRLHSSLVFEISFRLAAPSSSRGGVKPGAKARPRGRCSGSGPVGRSTACLPPKKGEAAMKYPIQSICKRCHRETTEVATILPMGGSPGLIAFLCARCGKSNSILVEPELQIRGKQLAAYQATQTSE